MSENASLNSKNTRMPTNHAATRIVPRLASPLASFDAWLSGPPTTDLERNRAQLAEIKNSRRSGTPFG